MLDCNSGCLENPDERSWKNDVMPSIRSFCIRTENGDRRLLGSDTIDSRVMARRATSHGRQRPSYVKPAIIPPQTSVKAQVNRGRRELCWFPDCDLRRTWCVASLTLFAALRVISNTVKKAANPENGQIRCFDQGLEFTYHRHPSRIPIPIQPIHAQPFHRRLSSRAGLV